MLWFALHLNELPLEAWLVAEPQACAESPQACAESPQAGRGTAPDDAGINPAASSPAAVVAEARRVVLADAAAVALGIAPGMSVATAASLAAGLRVFARDAAREAAQVERLALALARFTPAVVVQRDGVLLEVAASLRLFGGAAALWRAVRDAALAVGVRALRRAAAPTAAAAAVLARAEPPSAVLRRRPLRERLDALPLAAVAQAWAIEPRLAALLHGIGCRTLGDVRVLPRHGAHRRGAAALLDQAARAYGEAPDPQPWFEPPPRFEQGLELLHRADDAAALVFAAGRLVQPLAGWLAQQWLAATRLTLVLRHETSLRHAQPDTELALALADPTREAAQIALLLRERLQRTALPAPVYGLRLRLDQAAAHAGRAAPLWREQGRSTGHEEARALFDRLAARLGAGQVRRPVLVADHRPEQAMRLVPLGQGGGKAGAALDLPPAPAAHLDEVQGVPAEAPRSASTSSARRGALRDAGLGHAAPLPPRPAWLLPEPLPLREEGGALGRPLHQGAPLALVGRAERIEAGWFDGAPVARDYHLAQAGDRRWLWVFRERRGEHSRWFLHGVFG